MSHRGAGMLHNRLLGLGALQVGATSRIGHRAEGVMRPAKQTRSRGQRSRPLSSRSRSRRGRRGEERSSAAAGAGWQSSRETLAKRGSSIRTRSPLSAPTKKRLSSTSLSRARRAVSSAGSRLYDRGTRNDDEARTCFSRAEAAGDSATLACCVLDGDQPRSRTRQRPTLPPPTEAGSGAGPFPARHWWSETRRPVPRGSRRADSLGSKARWSTTTEMSSKPLVGSAID